MHVLSLSLPILLCATLLSACDLVSDNDPQQAFAQHFTPVSGQLFDRPLANMKYHSTHFSGVTSSLGEFLYKPNESISFSLGNYQFPKIKAAPKLNILTLLQTKQITASVLNLSRLLQSINLNTTEAPLLLPDLNQFDLSHLDLSLPPARFAKDSIVLSVLAKFGNQKNPLQLIPKQQAINQLQTRLPDMVSSRQPSVLTLINDKPNSLLTLINKLAGKNETQRSVQARSISLASMANFH